MSKSFKIYCTCGSDQEIINNTPIDLSKIKHFELQKTFLGIHYIYFFDTKPYEQAYQVTTDLWGFEKWEDAIEQLDLINLITELYTI